MSKKHPLTICFYGTYDREYTSNKLILSGLKKNDVKVIEVNAQIPVTRLDKQNQMSWFNLIKRIIKKYRIIPVTLKNWGRIMTCDVIYVGYPGHFDVFFATIVARLTGKKLVFNPLLVIYIGFAEEQGILKKDSLLGKAIKAVEGYAYRLCDVVIADTPFQATFFRDIFGVPKEKIAVLAIGADDEYYRHTPYTNTQKKLTIVYYGLYSPIHGVQYIIDAANKLKNDKDIKFVMVGNGNTFQENYDRAQKLGLSNMTFYYDVPIEKHPAIIEQGDVFLGFLEKHPSVERVIPNKVYQGLALNKVVLTADSPVIRSVFEDNENIYMIKPASTKALYDSIVELKENPQLRKKIATNGYSLFIKNFSPAAVGKKLVTIIEHVNDIS